MAAAVVAANRSTQSFISTKCNCYIFFTLPLVQLF